MAQHSPSWCNNSTGWLVTIHQILMPISLLIDQTGKTEQVEPAKLFQEPQQESRWTQRVQQRTSWLRCVPRVRRDGGVVAGSRQPAYLGKTTSQWACHQCPIGVHFFQDGGKWSNGRMILVGTTFYKVMAEANVDSFAKIEHINPLVEIYVQKTGKILRIKRFINEKFRLYQCREHINCPFAWDSCLEAHQEWWYVVCYL